MKFHLLMRYKVKRPKTPKKPRKVKHPETDQRVRLLCEGCGQEYTRREFHSHLFALPGIRRFLCTGMDKKLIDTCAHMSKKRMQSIERKVRHLENLGLTGDTLMLARMTLIWG
jgi:hypothetical protein